MQQINEPTIVKNCILIAKFMGYEVIPYQNNVYKPIYNGNKFAKTVDEKKNLWGGLDLQFTGRFTEFVQYPFHSDFNYLIPIIRRIEEMGYVVLIAGIKYQVYTLLNEESPIISLVCGDLTKKTEMVYWLIVKFLEYLESEK